MRFSGYKGHWNWCLVTWGCGRRNSREDPFPVDRSTDNDLRVDQEHGVAVDCNADRAEVIRLPRGWLGQHLDSTVGRGGIVLRLSEGFLGAFTEYGIEESHVCLFR